MTVGMSSTVVSKTTSNHSQSLNPFSFMGRLSIKTSNSIVSASRGILRKTIRLAGRGDRYAFKAVADPYLNFVTEYLVVTGYHDSDRIRSLTRKIFQNLWQRIAYTRRVSDLERQLFIFLKQIPVNVSPFQDLLTQKLVMLNALQRFLLVGRDLENWNSKNLSLASRLPKQDLSQPLYDAWKILVGFKKADLDFTTNECMQKVVESMEGGLDAYQQKRLCRKVKENATVSAFKADCLNLRCELVELRQNSRWDAKEKKQFFEELLEDIALITPAKPDLVERFQNQLSFQCAPLEVREG